MGTTYLYKPVLGKKDYLKGHLTGIVTNYFDGSFTRLATFFARENDLNMSELQEIISDIETELKDADNHE